MNAHEEIIRLYKSLSDDGKDAVLKELNQTSNAGACTIVNVPAVCCPHCESRLFVKNGKLGPIQKYKCKTCCRVFTAKTGTSLHGLHKPEKFELYKSLMLESYYPIKQIAEKVGTSVQTAFDWRHKILAGTVTDDGPFEGITETDDIWFLYSQKGRKGLDHSRGRGGSKRAGDNDFQAKLLITSDRNRTTDFSLARIGRLKKADMERKVGGRFSNDCILVSDKHRSISAFARSENLEHVSFKASEHTAGGEYHVQNINNMAASLKTMVNGTLKGVSTKYLQNYANWYWLRRNKTSAKELGAMLAKNKDALRSYINREGIYKWFIENFSRRTYRCPVKKTHLSALDQEALGKLALA